MSDHRTPAIERVPGIFLLVSVFVIAICGLVYELLAASLSTYLLGSSVTHFSIVIGIFLTAMGLGSYLTRFVIRYLADAFIAVQIGIGLIGGLSAAILLFTFSVTDVYLPVLVGVLLLTGSFVGMEIPILIRILRSREALRVTVANVLALDYLGALFASAAFPLFFVPYVGLLRTSFIFGLINIAVAGVGIRVLRPMLRRSLKLTTAAVVAAVVLAVGLLGSGAFSSFTESLLYQDDIVLTRQTPYQRLVVTRWRDDVRLFIDGNLQFSTVDEHRYHETLVHPALSALPGAETVLILGGGDGLAAREVLKHANIQRIDLVDLDGEMIKLFREVPFLANLSGNALSNPQVSVHVQDAGKFLEETSSSWDVILIDLPDPNNLSLGRLYTRSFYRLAARRLAATGIIVTQATSPFYAPEAFWCIVETLRSTTFGPEEKDRFYVYPYHAYIPSFGDWGFVMASRKPVAPPRLTLKPGMALKFLSSEMLPSLFSFPQDTLSPQAIEPNRLDDQVLVKYYRHGWRRFGP
ncbi:MAG: polyamine aminopropyltransferase [Desulfomonile sp.]|nr:polyamine aminopropyltransferase [Desulfomonile sp.]